MSDDGLVIGEDADDVMRRLILRVSPSIGWFNQAFGQCTDGNAA